MSKLARGNYVRLVGQDCTAYKQGHRVGYITEAALGQVRQDTLFLSDNFKASDYSSSQATGAGSLQMPIISFDNLNI